MSRTLDPNSIVYVRNPFIRSSPSVHSNAYDAPPPYYSTQLPAYSTSGTDPNEFNHEPKLVASCRKLGISSLFGSQLHHVADFSRIRVAIDVSGSMSENLKYHAFSTEESSKSRFPWHRETRWQELRSQLKLLFELCTEEELAPEGIDVFFIHDQKVKKRPIDRMGVRSWEEMESILPKKPRGAFTPTVDTVERMFSPAAMPAEGGPTLTLIFTDGVPNDGHGGNDTLKLQRRLAQMLNQFPQSHISIVLCTDDDRVVEDFNHFDRISSRLDVIDDYYSERKEIQRMQGAMFPFSRADYAVKLLLGSKIALWDKLDERPLTREQLEMFKNYGKVWEWGETWQDQCAQRGYLDLPFRSTYGSMSTRFAGSPSSAMWSRYHI